MSQVKKSLSREAMSQVKKSRVHAPHRYTLIGELWVGGELNVANPAFRFGAQLVDKLRAVDDLKGSSAHEAAITKAPIYSPPLVSHSTTEYVVR